MVKRASESHLWWQSKQGGKGNRVWHHCRINHWYCNSCSGIWIKVKRWAPPTAFASIWSSFNWSPMAERYVFPAQANGKHSNFKRNRPHNFSKSRVPLYVQHITRISRALLSAAESRPGWVCLLLSVHKTDPQVWRCTVTTDSPQQKTWTKSIWQNACLMKKTNMMRRKVRQWLGRVQSVARLMLHSVATDGGLFVGLWNLRAWSLRVHMMRLLFSVLSALKEFTHGIPRFAAKIIFYLNEIPLHDNDCTYDNAIQNTLSNCWIWGRFLAQQILGEPVFSTQRTGR